MPYTSKMPQDIYTTSFLKTPGPSDGWEPWEDTPQEYLEAIRNPHVCRYAIKTTKAGKWLECEMYPMWIATRDVPRAPKIASSSQAQKDLNDRNAKRRFCRKVNANFVEFIDWWATFTCDDEHLFLTEAAAQDFVGLFLKRLRRMYRGLDLELKYAYAIEYKMARDKYKRPIRDPETGEQLVRPHIHIVLNAGPTAQQIMAKWQGGAIMQMRPLQPSHTGYTGLAKYITKSPKAGRRRFACSTNLKEPTVTTSYNNRKASKNAVQRLAKDEQARPEWFEKLYRGKYKFVDCEAKYNAVNDGTYLYCRLELADDPPPPKPPRKNTPPPAA